jgi:hypothetical protein
MLAKGICDQAFRCDRADAARALRFGISILFFVCLTLLAYRTCGAAAAQTTNGTASASGNSAQNSDSNSGAAPLLYDPNAGDQWVPITLWMPQRHPPTQLQFDYYRDSDGNQVSNLTSLINATIGKTTLTLRREEVAARGLHGDDGSDATVVSGYGKVWNWLLVGGGIGVIDTNDGSSSLAGSLLSTATAGNLEITMGAARGLLEATAETISHHVMQTDLYMTLWDDITDDLGSDVELHHKIFSDGNSENDFSVAPEYSFAIRKIKLTLDWTLEYQSFAQPTKLGYYAPQGLLSNEPSISWKFDRAGYYGLLKVGMTRAYQLYQSQWMPSFNGTGVAAIGKRLTERIALEGYVTAGRNSLGVPAGWNSMNTGLKLNYSF